MRQVGMGSILRKAEKTVKSKAFKQEQQAYVQDVLSGNVTVNVGNGSIHSATETAEKFIEVLRNHINTSGLSSNAAGALQDISYGDPVCNGSMCTIKVLFDGDTHRDSLYPAGYPGGINHLEELLDQGVGHTMKPVYGEWHGEMIRSRTTIPGAHFIDAAIHDFMMRDGTEYNVVGINVEFEH